MVPAAMIDGRTAFLLGLLFVSCSGGPGGGDPELTCDGTEPNVTLADDVQPILTAKCTSGCHLAGDSYADYTSAAESAKTVGQTSRFAGQTGTLQIVAPAALDNSSMWLKLLGGQLKGRAGPKGENVGSAMPQGNVALTSAELATVKRWICTGAR